ncbi:MAG: hypothetical protein WC076_11435, partial [Terrimicrobiaceae bacterium]
WNTGLLPAAGAFPHITIRRKMQSCSPFHIRPPGSLLSSYNYLAKTPVNSRFGRSVSQASKPFM